MALFFTGLRALPRVWLLLVLLTLIVTLQEGHLPTYGNPDPKQTGLALLHLPMVLLLGPTLLSPLPWILSSHFFWLPLLVARRDVLLFLSGWLLSVALLMSDWSGLMKWLID